MNINQRVGSNIRTKRKELNFTQEELACKMKITRQNLGSYESGANNFKLSILEKFAKVLKTNIVELIN